MGGNTNKDATYFAYHIRRGDFQFQYKHTFISIEEIWKNTRHLWDEKRTRLMYIATDEKNRTMFDPLKEVKNFNISNILTILNILNIFYWNFMFEQYISILSFLFNLFFGVGIQCVCLTNVLLNTK